MEQPDTLTGWLFLRGSIVGGPFKAWKLITSTGIHSIIGVITYEKLPAVKTCRIQKELEVEQLVMAELGLHRFSYKVKAIHWGHSIQNYRLAKHI
jgi:hypothetical protein